jgi:hypothetical protein
VRAAVVVQATIVPLWVYSNRGIRKGKLIDLVTQFGWETKERLLGLIGLRDLRLISRGSLARDNDLHKVVHVAEIHVGA